MGEIEMQKRGKPLTVDEMTCVVEAIGGSEKLKQRILRLVATDPNCTLRLDATWRSVIRQFAKELTAQRAALK